MKLFICLLAAIGGLHAIAIVEERELDAPQEVVASQIETINEHVAGLDGGDIMMPSSQNVYDHIIELNKNNKDLQFGDIADFPAFPEDHDFHSASDTEKRGIVKESSRRWKSKTIPVVFDPSIGSGSKKQAIEKAFEEFKKRTCIRFVPAKSDEYYIKFINGDGCYSSLGNIQSKNRASQDVSIADGCTLQGIIDHELMHALGFFHEQARPDRDNYVRINWENIKDGKASQFKKQRKSAMNTFGMGYDYDGVMHYGEYDFSKKRWGAGKLKTIEVIGGKGEEWLKTGAKVGQRKGMSQDDVNAINLAYNCDSNELGMDYSEWTAWGPCNGLCTSERERICYIADQSKCGKGFHDRVQIAQRKCRNCGVDGGFGDWGQWTGGSKDGKKPMTRTRECNNPKPYGRGRTCFGINTETLNCYDYAFGRNGDVQCDGWIKGDVNECDSWVTPRCQKSCKKCSTRNNDVLRCNSYKPDKTTSCKRWMTSGSRWGKHCQMSITWTEDGKTSRQEMKHLCQTTCKSCS